MKHVVITREKLPLLHSLAKRAGVSLERKKVLIYEVKFIIPNSFHPKLWERNWMHVYDILSNGDIYGELIVLVIEHPNDLNKLNNVQKRLIERRSIVIY